jgi:uncharacterized protein YkwD
VKRVLPFLAALLCAACVAEPPATPTRAAIVFITFTPSPVVAVTPTEEALPFRDLSSPTETETAVPPTDTPAPATATSVVVAPTQPPARPTNKPAPLIAQPTSAPIVQAQVTAAVVVDPPTQAPAPTAIPVQPAGDAASAEQAIIDLTNNYRAQSGLPPLARDENMMSIARGRSADMVNRGYFGHYDPVTGQSLGKPLILALGYNRAGENIYWSGKPLSDLPANSVGWFMGDAPHRANILNTAYTVLGVGVVWNGLGWTLTQDFGGP